jgi:Ca2+-binding RTX toxin-like protein
MRRVKNLLVAAVVVASTAGLGLVAAPTASSVGPLIYKADLKGANEVPPNASTATGSVTVTLNATEDKAAVALTYSGLGSNSTAAHIHQAPAGASGPVLLALPITPGVTAGSLSQTFDVTPVLVAAMRAGNAYVNIHSTGFGSGEIRGQLAPVAGSELKCRGKAATKVGTQGDDLLLGTGGPDVIVGLGGDDVIRGLGGDDLICGNSGNDVLLGERGADVLVAGGGDDELWGGRGRDRLFGDQGKDELSGGAGSDFGAGGAGKDSMDSIERP